MSGSYHQPGYSAIFPVGRRFFLVLRGPTDSRSSTKGDERFIACRIGHGGAGDARTGSGPSPGGHPRSRSSHSVRDSVPIRLREGDGPRPAGFHASCRGRQIRRGGRLDARSLSRERMDRRTIGRARGRGRAHAARRGGAVGNRVQTIQCVRRGLHTIHAADPRRPIGARRARTEFCRGLCSSSTGDAGRGWAVKQYLVNVFRFSQRKERERATFYVSRTTLTSG